MLKNENFRYFCDGCLKLTVDWGSVSTAIKCNHDDLSAKIDQIKDELVTVKKVIETNENTVYNSLAKTIDKMINKSSSNQAQEQEHQQNKEHQLLWPLPSQQSNPPLLQIQPTNNRLWSDAVKTPDIDGFTLVNG